MKPLFRDGVFEQDVVLITGGGTGIGALAALEMGRLGAQIAICGRRPEPLEAQAEALRGEGIEVHHGSVDIRDPDSILVFVEAVKERFGGIHVLVNNAGGQFPMAAQHLSPRGFEAVVRNNLLGTWNMTHAVATVAMIPAEGGRIVNVIAEISRGFPGMVHTGAARAGVENMTKTLAVEWAQFGIRVNAVAPGVIVSTGTRQYPREILVAAKQANPMRRLGSPAEVSHLITYLASPQADFITGQTVIIDGGASLWGSVWQVPEQVPQHPPYAVEEP